MRWSQAWGFKSHWDTPVLAQPGLEQLLPGGSVEHELFYRLGRFAGIFVSVSRLRRAMPQKFRRHQLALVLERWLQSGQLCQKQPSTTAATRTPRSKK